MRELKTAAAAWRWLGREMEKAQAMPTIPGVDYFGLNPDGLCACITRMYVARLIAHDTRYVMGAQIESHMQALEESTDSILAFLDSPRRFEVRVMACELLAKEAEYEARRKTSAQWRMNKQILKASEAIGDDDDYLARTNVVPEGASVDEWVAGSGGEGFDEPSNHESLNTDLDIDDDDDDDDEDEDGDDAPLGWRADPFDGDDPDDDDDGEDDGWERLFDDSEPLSDDEDILNTDDDDLPF